MIQISIYDPATGQVLKVVSGTNEDDVLANVKDGQAYIMGPTDAAEQWINPETGRRRKLQTLKPVVADNLISKLPIGAVATIKGQSFVADENGEIAVAAELGLPETVSVDIRAAGHLPLTVTLPLTQDGFGSPVAQRFDQVRREQYRRDGISVEALVIALIEDREGDSSALDELLTKRRAVRERIVKTETS